MARNSKISWTGSTWNPLRGCDVVSPGCKNCYAQRMAHRYNKPGMWGAGLTVLRSGRPSWTGHLEFARHKLDEPLRWQQPRRIFPCSGADLFHEGVSFEYIAAMFGVMGAARRHTFQVLTKRAERVPEFFEWLVEGPGSKGYVWQSLYQHARHAGVSARYLDDGSMGSPWPWPLPNVWMGTSVENNDYRHRIDAIRRAPAAVRWVSCEPLLGRLDLSPHLTGKDALDWVVVGGESGRPGHDCRPCALEWVDELKEQCLEAAVPVFVKQLGSFVVSEARMAESVEEANDLRRGLGHTERDDPFLWEAGLRDAKGEDPDEWPEHMAVRLYPGDPIPDPSTWRFEEQPCDEVPF